MNDFDQEIKERKKNLLGYYNTWLLQYLLTYSLYKMNNKVNQQILSEGEFVTRSDINPSGLFTDIVTSELSRKYGCKNHFI